MTILSNYTDCFATAATTSNKSIGFDTNGINLVVIISDQADCSSLLLSPTVQLTAMCAELLPSDNTGLEKITLGTFELGEPENSADIVVELQEKCSFKEFPKLVVF